MVLFNMPLFIPKAFQPIVMRRLILLSWSFSNFITCPRCLLTSYGLFPLESWTVCYFFRFLFSNRWNINMKCSLILWNQAIIYCPQTKTWNRKSLYFAFDKWKTDASVFRAAKATKKGCCYSTGIGSHRSWCIQPAMYLLLPGNMRMRDILK